MAMSRAQFPEVMGFQEGGLISSFDVMDPFDPENNFEINPLATTDTLTPVSSPSGITLEETTATDTAMQELLKALTESKFDTDVEKYKERLESAMPPLRRPDFYDLASDLGAALLSAPADAGAFRGIGIGLTNFNKRVKDQYESAQKERRQIALKATELAMENEQKAEDFLQKYFLEAYGSLSEDPEYVTLQYDEMDADGNLTGNKITRSFDKTTQAKKIAQIFKTQNGVVVSDLPAKPGSSPLDEKAAGDILKNITEIDTEGTQGYSKLDAIQKAKVLAAQIGEENFGAQNSFILPVQQFLLGVLPKEAATFIDPDKVVAPKEALAAISIVFTLANVAQTKGAISEMEMRLFQRAAPFLGQTYEGFMLALEIQEQAAKKKIQFADEYSSEYEKLITNNPDMEERKIHAHMLEWKSTWARENMDSFITEDQKKLISKYEADAKKAGARGDYTKYDSYLERYEKAMKAERDRNLTLSNQAISQNLGPIGTMKNNLVLAGIDQTTVDRMTDEQVKEAHERFYGSSL